MFCGDFRFRPLGSFNTLSPPFQTHSSQSVDCCGLCMCIVTWFLIGYAVVVVSDILYHWMGFTVEAAVLEGVMVLLAAMCYLSHFRAMTTNPGAIPQGARPLPAKEDYEKQDDPSKKDIPYKSWCKRCASYKPPRAHHDSCTDRCVSKMDHFCPWVNNCVGVLNHKLFLLFLFYIFMISSFSLGIVATRAVSCVSSAPEKSPAPTMMMKRRRRHRHDESLVVKVFESFFDSGECHLGLPVCLISFSLCVFLTPTFNTLCMNSTEMRFNYYFLNRCSSW